MVTFDLALWWFIPRANSHSTAAAAGRLDVSILRALNWHPQGLPAPEHWPSASVELPDRKTWERKTTAGERKKPFGAWMLGKWVSVPGDVSVLEKPQIRPRHPSSVTSSLTGGRRGISYTEEPQGGQGHLEGFCASLVMRPSATATTLALGTSGPPSILTPFSPLHFSDLHSIPPDLWLPSVAATL